MKVGQNLGVGIIGLAFIAVPPGTPSSFPSGGAPTQMVVTAIPAPGNDAPVSLGADDVSVQVGKLPAHILGSRRLSGDLADTQLFVLLDDSTRSSSLSLQLRELKTFIESLPATTEVAVGYMRNGTASLAQGFVMDHQKAADSLRLPQAIPGENGSPYFALSDLVKHWPSKESAGRRVVLMITDGVDRYFGSSLIDDPYVNQSISDALKHGVQVYSIYLRGAGLYGRGDWTMNVAQSRLSQVSEETGGFAYFLGFTDPVSVAPFLSDFQSRLDHRYVLTIQANERGLQPVQVRSELRNLKIVGPTRVYLQ